MKKVLCGVLVLSILFLFCGCVNFFPLRVSGVYKSSDPMLWVDFDSGSPTTIGDQGELTLSDNTVVKIVFAETHGEFSIMEYREDGNYADAKCFYEGDCWQYQNTLRLYVNDGSIIVLTSVSK